MKVVATLKRYPVVTAKLTARARQNVLLEKYGFETHDMAQIKR